MRKAGLNPMLAFSQGGASSPMGSVAPISNIFGNLATDVAAGVTSGAREKEATIKGSLLRHQVKNLDAMTVAATAAAQKAGQETNTSAATQKKIEEETAILAASRPYRADLEYGKLPWSGKAKRALRQQEEPGFWDKFFQKINDWTERSHKEQWKEYNRRNNQ